MEEEEVVEAEPLSTAARLGRPMATGTATMTASSARWCAREGSRGGDGVQGERGEVQGGEGECVALGAGSRSGGSKQEVAGRVLACAGHALVPLARGKTTGRSRGGLGHPATVLGRLVAPGKCPW